MIKNILTIIIKIFKIKKIFFLDKNTRKYIDFNKRLFKYQSTDCAEVILVDLFDWNPFIFFWSILSNYLKKKEKLKIEFFYFPLYKTIAQNSFFFKKNIIKIYRSFGCELGITSIGKKMSAQKLKEVEKLFKSIKNDSELINYKYKNILLGDLIYDSTLRSYQIPTTSIKEKKLKEKFFEAHLIFEIIELYLKNNKVKYLIPSDITYNQYGIICRICNYNSIKIFTLRNLGRGLTNFKLASYDTITQSNQNPYYKYKKIFKKNFINHDRKIALTIGKKKLMQRLKGNVESGIEYITQSPFTIKKRNNSKKYLFKNNKCKVLLALHNFYDSPHKYRNLFYKDYLEWAIETIEILNKKEVNIYIKFHPLKIDNSTELVTHKIIINKIKNMSNVKIIDSKINYYDLINNNLDFAITCHGTIANELPYFGVKVINCGDNPHINYKFCINPKSKSDYVNYLHNLEKIKLKINKDEIYEFYFMNYHYFDHINFTHKLKKEYLTKKFKKDISEESIRYHQSSKYFNYIIKKQKQFNIINKIEKYIEEYLRLDM